MGYALVVGDCGMCGRIFSFNPLFVPSLKNVPFCKDCIDKANVIREEKGMELLAIHPEAYEACDEREL